MPTIVFLGNGVRGLEPYMDLGPRAAARASSQGRLLRRRMFAERSSSASWAMSVEGNDGVGAGDYHAVSGTVRLGVPLN